MKISISEIHLGLTDNCNFSCDYCFYGKENPSDLRIDDGKQAIDFISENTSGSVKINYFGGEPLLMFSNLRDITNYARSKQREDLSFRFGLDTNGSLLSDDKIDFLLSNHFSVLFSFDGIKKAQDSHRRLANGGSSYEMVIGNLHRALKKGLQLMVRQTITPKNVRYLSDSIQFLLNLKVKEIAFDLAYESGWTGYDMHILRNEIEKVAELYSDNLLRSEENIILYPFHDILISRIKSISLPRCGAGKHNFYIAPNKEIFFCCWFRGSMERESFAKIGDLQNGLDYNKLEEINNQINSAVKNRFDCPRCDYENLCTKYCLAHNFLCTGNPFTVTPSKCAYEKIRIENALKIGKKLYEKGHPYINTLINDLLFV